ncbi:hypothetical protein HanRHA438_Chr07g0322091 [Helianthus annuus]|nr:hypothetical protein HanRHA438_Chr07g0322091 [Helianthus annuus]
MKWKVSGPTVHNVGYKSVFYTNHVKIKLNDISQNWWHKNFSQRPIIDYEKTYSPVVDALTFQCLFSLVIYKRELTCVLGKLCIT